MGRKRAVVRDGDAASQSKESDDEMKKSASGQWVIEDDSSQEGMPTPTKSAAGKTDDSKFEGHSSPHNTRHSKKKIETVVSLVSDDDEEEEEVEQKVENKTDDGDQDDYDDGDDDDDIIILDDDDDDDEELEDEKEKTKSKSPPLKRNVKKSTPQKQPAKPQSKSPGNKTSPGPKAGKFEADLGLKRKHEEGEGVVSGDVSKKTRLGSGSMEDKSAMVVDTDNMDDFDKVTSPIKERSSISIMKENWKGKHLFKRVFEIGDQQALVILYFPEEVAFKGKVRLRCLQGTVDVMGYIIKPSRLFQNVYSPETHGLLTIVAHSTHQDRDKLQLALDKLSIDDPNLRRDVINNSEGAVILVLQHLSCKVCDFATSMPPFRSAFHSTKKDVTSETRLLEEVGVKLVYDPYAARLHIPDDYRHVSNILNENLVKGKSLIVALCGGKNVGKSTLARYLINSALGKCAEVAYLECDPGQTEFTPPGILSLSVITKPLLGPPFTHMSRPKFQCFVGCVSPQDCPDHYLHCLKLCWKAYIQLPHRCPLIINTMGWIKGLGINFLVETLFLVRPHLIVQLHSANRNRNLPPVTLDWLWLNKGWPYQKPVESYYDYEDHQLVSIESQTTSDQRKDRYQSARDHRDLSTMGYLGQLVTGVVGDGATGLLTSLLSLAPYRLSWDAVAIAVCHTEVPNSQILYAMNCSAVGLCTVPKDKMVECKEAAGVPRFLKDTPVCSCVGIGIVRGIDPKERVFYILTPVPPSELQHVNCLLRGAVELPTQLLLKQKNAGPVPYIGYPRDSIGAGAVSKRRFMARGQSADR